MQPRPTVRNRVYTIGCQRSMSLAPVEQAIHFMQQNEGPVHHASMFLLPGEVVETVPMEIDPSKEENYAKCFRVAWQKPVAAKKLPEHLQCPRPDDRYTATTSGLPALSPWMRAQLDVRLCPIQVLEVHTGQSFTFHLTAPRYHLILRENSTEQHELYWPVADVSQTCGRGGTHTDGTVPCLCTSSKLFYFGERPRLPGCAHTYRNTCCLVCWTQVSHHCRVHGYDGLLKL